MIKPKPNWGYSSRWLLASLMGACTFLFLTAPVNAAVSSETAYIFSTLSFLMHGFLVLWMAAGFAMLEAGMVRTKSVTTILLKNIALFSIAGVAFYLVGYNLMYDGVDGGLIGSLAIWTANDGKALGGDFSAGYAASSDWFFQMVFVATAASIVSGALAERIKLWPFLVFVLALTAVIYPIQGAWQWGGGWLSKLGFIDFAGSTVVHSVGGWAALTGAIILGTRRGRYRPDGKVQAQRLIASVPSLRPGEGIPDLTPPSMAERAAWNAPGDMDEVSPGHCVRRSREAA